MTTASNDLRERIRELREVLLANNSPGANPSALHKLGVLANAVAGIDPESGSKARELLALAGKFYDAEKWRRAKDSPEALHSRMSFELLNWLETRANILEHHGA